MKILSGTINALLTKQVSVAVSDRW